MTISNIITNEIKEFENELVFTIIYHIEKRFWSNIIDFVDKINKYFGRNKLTNSGKITQDKREKREKRRRGKHNREW